MKHVTKTSVVILVIICLYAAKARALVVYASTETYTGVTTWGHVGGSYPSYYDYTQNASTTVTNSQRRDADTSFISEGYVEGQGFADFGTLKNRLELGGLSGQTGISTSVFNDHWTINNPSLAGQQGIMTLAFDLSGSTTVLDTLANTLLSDEYAGVGLYVDINPGDISAGTYVLEYQASLGSGQTQINGIQGSPTVTLPINFIYGQEFGVRVTLRTTAQSDNTWLRITFNPYFEQYGGGIIDSITVDFLNTAQISAIVLPDDPLTSLSSSSLTDFSPLITDSLPIPEPASLGLLVIGGLAMLRRR